METRQTRICCNETTKPSIVAIAECIETKKEEEEKKGRPLKIKAE